MHHKLTRISLYLQLEPRSDWSWSILATAALGGTGNESSATRLELSELQTAIKVIVFNMQYSSRIDSGPVVSGQI